MSLEFARYLRSTHVSLRLQFETQICDLVSGTMKDKESSCTPSQNKCLMIHISAIDWPSLQTILFRYQWSRFYNDVTLSAGKSIRLATQLL
jgi:hypothetical protein